MRPTTLRNSPTVSKPRSVSYLSRPSYSPATNAARCITCQTCLPRIAIPIVRADLSHESYLSGQPLYSPLDKVTDHRKLDRVQVQHLQLIRKDVILCEMCLTAWHYLLSAEGVFAKSCEAPRRSASAPLEALGRWYLSPALLTLYIHIHQSEGIHCLLLYFSSLSNDSLYYTHMGASNLVSSKVRFCHRATTMSMISWVDLCELHRQGGSDTQSASTIPCFSDADATLALSLGREMDTRFTASAAAGYRIRPVRTNPVRWTSTVIAAHVRDGCKNQDAIITPRRLVWDGRRNSMEQPIGRDRDRGFLNQGTGMSFDLRTAHGRRLG